MAIVARRSQKKCKLRQSVTYEQMSEFLDCFLRLFSQSPTRSPIEMFWAAKSKLFSRKWKERKTTLVGPNVHLGSIRRPNEQTIINAVKISTKYVEI